MQFEMLAWTSHIKQDDRLVLGSVYHSPQQLKKEKQSAEEKHGREDRKERR